MSEQNSKKKTSIIILNYNAGKLLEKCISSVLKTKNNDFEIIVVDNASIDKSHLQCKEKFPEIILIENKKNQGYCEGNNLGFKNAKGDYIVILNPDTEVEPNWLIELFREYEKHGEGLYQPKLLQVDDKNRFDSAGNSLTVFGFPYHRGFMEKDFGQYDKFQQINYASGACLFTSRKTLEKIGYFDPYLFAYYDDSNLAWRAAYAEIKSYYIPSSVVYHKGSYSFKNNPKKYYLLQRNRWYCLLTLYSHRTFYRILPSIILLEGILFFYSISKGLIKEKIQSYIDIIKDRNLIRKKYTELESKKKISDKEMIKNILEFLDTKNSGSISKGIFQKIEFFLGKLSYKIL